MKTESADLKILNLLMRHNKHITTKEICDIVGCDRKTVYRAIDSLECAGFGVEVKKEPLNGDGYKYIGIFAF